MRPMVVALLVTAAAPVGALTELLYDAEPNNTPYQAVEFSLPDDKNSLKILGELAPGDQDAYRFVVDEDEAGKRVNLSLSGRAGALTQVDVLDFTEIADGRGRIPETLTQRPVNLMTLSAKDGARATQIDALLFAPGVYVLGVSHSGGEGAYSVEMTELDESRVKVLADDEASADSPQRISPGGDLHVWTQGETWFQFELDDRDLQWAYTLVFQSALDHPASVRLFDAEDTELLALAVEGGVPVTRPGLQLDAGVYRIRTDQPRAGTQVLALERSAPAAQAGRETEPNDSVPTPVPFGEPIAGRFDGSDTDWLAFEVDAEEAQRRFDLRLLGGPESAVEVCLIRRSINLSHCLRGQDGVTEMRSLGLSQGAYRLRLSDRGPEGADWQLEWIERGEARVGEELEPNDSHEHPVALHPRGFGRGAFDGRRETDHWRFSVQGEPQLWRLQLQGEDLHEIQLKGVGGKVLASERAGNASRVRLDNLFLMPGEYVIGAQGDSGDYILRAQPLGPPPPGMEIEPNDDVANARLMRFGEQYFGTLSAPGDDDRWRFTLSGYEHVRLTVQPPVDGGIRGYLGVGDEAETISEVRHGRAPGAPLVWDVFLPAGDYHLWLRPGDLSDAEYTVRLERAEWFGDFADREPNDYREQASPFPADGRIHGQVGATARGTDWYRLPRVERPRTVDWQSPSGIRLEVVDAIEPGNDRSVFDRDTDSHSVTLAPGQDYWLEISGDGAYDLDFSALSDRGSTPAGTPPGLTVELEPETIQAFSPWRQTLGGEIVVTNVGSAERDLNVETQLSDERWRLTGVPSEIHLAAGEERRLPVRVVIDPDATVEPPARLSVRVHDGTDFGATASATAEIALDAAPVRPEFHWPLDEPLRGAINAAALRFGAKPVESPGLDAGDVETSARLYDGLARYGRWTGMTLPTGADDHDEWGRPTVALAGDAPVPVRGFLLNPTSILGTRRYLGEFEIALSMDGEKFETVIRDRLLPSKREQAFALPAPFMARFARLIPRGAALGSARSLNTVTLGEFKVLAEPGWRPAGPRINLADPANGGHLVHAAPWIRGSAFDTGVLIADDEAPAPRLSGETDAWLVLGFEHARAARIDGVEIDPAPSHENNPESVRVFVSTETPLGPWREVASADIGNGSTSIALPQPAWARYVRLVFGLPAAARAARFPDRVAVLEAQGPSVLGEWGHLADVGPYELEATPAWPGLSEAPDNQTRERAVALAEGVPTPGRALLDRYSAWYRISVPEGRNQISLVVNGRPSVEASPRLFDAAGEPVTVYATHAVPAEQRWEAYVEPGAEYLLEMFEPPRSVIFSWDTSGSVAAWLPVITNALMHYAETIKPGRDEVNLLPFGRAQPLLSDWVGQPYPLMRMLVAYPQETSSSNAEGTLSVAAREMVGRPGKKAVLLITDAATSTAPQLWPALRDGRPQVFAMKLSSVGAFGGDPLTEVDLMQDWSRVRGGHFEYVTGLGVLSSGLERAVARLKRPVDFSVAAGFATVEDPSPASLAVAFGEGAGDAAGAAARRGAVEIILDASGSMLKRMDGTRRIDIAKAAIRDTVENTLPDGLPLALRVYGHREAGSCRTDLEIPLAPLDKSAFLDQVETIQAINLARTPIADSLGAVASDLSSAEGRKLVVLLTDGEETCDGDPAAAIQRLVDGGVDVRVNIVGFAIDDEALKRQFSEWAAIGGGEYLDAGEAGELETAMHQALRVQFRVVDSASETVARGFVGGSPVEVPPGAYRVIVERADGEVAIAAELAPGDARVIEVD